MKTTIEIPTVAIYHFKGMIDEIPKDSNYNFGTNGDFV